MKCPKCSASFSGKPNEAGLLTCPSCGARLRAKTTAVFKAQGDQAKPAPPTHPPTPAAKRKAAARDKAAPAAEASGPLPQSSADEVMAQIEARRPLDIDATIPHGMTVPDFARAPTAAPSRTPPAAQPTPPGPATLEAVLAEVRAVRQTQEEILALLRGGSGSPRATPGTEVAGVLVIDDDAGARDAVAAAFSDEGVTAHVVPDGNQALAAIAEAKPAVIVLEIEIGGSMPGPDVLGMIKATMDWLDIPVILHTRASIPNEEAARADYGADHLVLKGPGSPQTLVALVHELLQKA